MSDPYHVIFVARTSRSDAAGLPALLSSLLAQDYCGEISVILASTEYESNDYLLSLATYWSFLVRHVMLADDGPRELYGYKVTNRVVSWLNSRSLDNDGRIWPDLSPPTHIVFTNGDNLYATPFLQRTIQAESLFVFTSFVCHHRCLDRCWLPRTPTAPFGQSDTYGVIGGIFKHARVDLGSVLLDFSLFLNATRHNITFLDEEHDADWMY
ncbi:MAG TPA: hypothetical protein V6D20_11740, partial [Candidatus Obscuribacterales bacterium]